MNLELKKPLTAIAYIVAFLAIQTVVQLIVLGAEMAIKGDTPQLDGIGFLIAMGSFSVITIALFAWLKWTPLKRTFIQSRPWMTLFWCFIASLGAIIPSVYFQEQMPEVTIVSDEAFRLDASVAVKLLVSALRLLTHPDDQLTKATIVKLYHIDVLKEQTEDNKLLLSTNDLDQLLPQTFLPQREVLLTMPLYDLAERLHAIFGLEALNEQSAYVFAFYDQLASYVSENTADIDSFLAAWDESICSKTIQSEETNGVRILSIHKSKGLEFNYVICPFCDWQLEKQSGNILWCQPDEQPFSDLHSSNNPLPAAR